MERLFYRPPSLRPSLGTTPINSIHPEPVLSGVEGGSGPARTGHKAERKHALFPSSDGVMQLGQAARLGGRQVSIPYEAGLRSERG